jgi:hypothetical protein
MAPTSNTRTIVDSLASSMALSVRAMGAPIAVKRIGRGGIRLVRRDRPQLSVDLRFRARETPDGFFVIEEPGASPFVFTSEHFTEGADQWTATVVSRALAYFSRLDRSDSRWKRILARLSGSSTAGA